jgi:cytoskeletal protein CcmA (bactofilin family)
MDQQKPDEPSNPDSTNASSSNEGESLEYNANAPQVISPTNPTTSTSTEGGSSESGSDNTIIQSGASKTPSTHTLGKVRGLWERINIYLLLFILILIISLVAVAVIYFKNRSTENKPSDSITQQQLSPEALEELAESGVQVGDPKQVLSVQSNSVFAGTVLVKGELQVAGGLKIGSGGLAIPEVTVGGTAVVNQLQTQSLAVAGNAAIQGQLTVQQSLSVNGNGTFNGAVTTPQITTGRLQLTGDLVLTRHIVAGGSIPGRTNGGSLGSGGTTSLSGSDTAGTITVNTGSGAGAGCLITVNFAQGFSSTPHVSVTPVGSGAAGLDYYINRTGSNFSVCTANAAPSNQSFGFDYIVLE